MGPLSCTPIFHYLNVALEEVRNLPEQEIQSNERFWNRIRSGYTLKPDYINLENGYYNIMPQEILDHQIRHLKMVNLHGSYYMRNMQWPNKDAITSKLANLIHANTDEVIITRNTTEALDTVISGVEWKKGDEAVYALQDYGAMKNQFKLMARKKGIVNKVISIPNHPTSDEEIVELYAQAITPKTKLVMICHMINLTGHILPVRKICDMAHRKGVDVMVDGAHAIGHIHVDVKELDCDYYGSSLHKWLSAPLGTGLLYIKKEKVNNIWPLFAEAGKKKDDIKKLNHTGTHPVHTDLSINNALAYLEKIGLDRKEKRLRYLQNYWTKQVRSLPRIILNTPIEKHRSCAIANVGIKDMSPKEMEERLLEEHNIWTVGIDGVGVQGCRITPNVYTTLEELDHFVLALKQLSST